MHLITPAFAYERAACMHVCTGAKVFISSLSRPPKAKTTGF